MVEGLQETQAELLRLADAVEAGDLSPADTAQVAAVLRTVHDGLGAAGGGGIDWAEISAAVVSSVLAALTGVYVWRGPSHKGIGVARP